MSPAVTFRAFLAVLAVVFLMAVYSLYAFGSDFIALIYHGEAGPFDFLISGQEQYPLARYQSVYAAWLQIMSAVAVFSIFAAALVVVDLASQGAQRKTLLLVGLAVVLFVIYGLFFFSSAGRDDIHITLWAAKALAASGEIQNLNLDPLEQSSSLLHVVVLAALSNVFGGNLVSLAVILSVVFGALSILLTWVLALQAQKEIAGSIAIFLSVSVFFAYWAFGGLETSFATLIVLLVAHGTYLSVQTGRWPHLLYAAAASAAYVAVRPEALFVLLAAYLAIAALSYRLYTLGTVQQAQVHRAARALVLLSAVSLLAFAALALYRLEYFGQIFPQPVYAKASGVSIGRVLQGMDYLIETLLQSPVFFCLTLLAYWGLLKLVLQRQELKRPLFWVVLYSLLTAGLAFIVFSGGDWMEGGRFIVQFMPLILVLASITLASFTVWQKPLFCAIAVGLVLETGVFAATTSTGMTLPEAIRTTKTSQQNELSGDVDFSWFEYANRVHLRDIPFVLKFNDVLATLTSGRESVTVMSPQMGMVSYHMASLYAGELEFIDIRALATEHFTECDDANSVAKNQTGLGLNYELLFSTDQNTLKQCGMNFPDVIFDLDPPGSPRARFLETQGYRIVYQQLGDIQIASSGGLVRSDQFIAVREQLVQEFDLPSGEVYHWPSGSGR